MKARPNYNYEHISKIIDAQRLEEKKKREMKEKEIRGQRQKQYMAEDSKLQ